MDGWAEAHVRDGRANLEIKPTPKKKLEPITARLRKTIPLGKNKYFIPLDFTADGQSLLGCNDQGGVALEIENGRIDLLVPWSAEPKINSIRISADGRTFYVGRYGTRTEQVVKDGKTSTVYRQTGRLDAYSVATGKRMPMFEGREPTSIMECIPSPDGNWLALCERTTITDLTLPFYRTVLWDLKLNRSIELARKHGSLLFSPDSKQLLASYNSRHGISELIRWNLSDLKPSVIASEPKLILWPVDISKDGRWTLLVQRHVLSENKPMAVELHHRDNDSVIWKGTLGGENFSHAVFDPKCRFLALIDNANGVRLLELATLKESQSFNLPKKSNALRPQFSPDGTRFAVITHDLSNSNIRSEDPESFEQPILWLADLSHPRRPERVVLPPNRSWQFVWAPDSKSVVVRALDCLWVVDATNIKPSSR